MIVPRWLQIREVGVGDGVFYRLACGEKLHDLEKLPRQLILLVGDAPPSGGSEGRLLSVDVARRAGGKDWEQIPELLAFVRDARCVNLNTAADRRFPTARAAALRDLAARWGDLARTALVIACGE